MKQARCITLIVAALGLGGCSLLSEQHPMVESSYMTPTEQSYWNDRQMRVDKKAEWDSTLERQSRLRMSHLMGN